MKLNKENIYKLSNIEDIKRFMTGGNAIMTLESKRTGRWFTYKIKRAKKDVENSPFFVSVLTGNDNETAYTYMGTIFNNDNKLIFKLTKNSKIGEDSLSYKAFNFFFKLMLDNKMHEEIVVYHRGICGRCNRALTTPDSLKSGLGPICENRIKIKS
jgi:hemerythrin superfamily protein